MNKTIEEIINEWANRVLVLEMSEQLLKETKKGLVPTVFKCAEIEDYINQNYTPNTQVQKQREEAYKKGYNKGYYAGKKSVRMSLEWCDATSERLHKKAYHLIEKPKFIKRILAVGQDEIRYVLRILDIHVTPDGTVVEVEYPQYLSQTKGGKE